MFEVSMFAVQSPGGYIYKPLPHNNLNQDDFYLFDHNGYDLTNAEILYCENSGNKVSTHRHVGHVALKYKWFNDRSRKFQEPIVGAHINHAALFERKGYKGEALFQLRETAQRFPIAHKVINIVPKWGVDLSIDYVDDGGNTFEVLHFEYDTFSRDEAHDIRMKVENIVTKTDWDDAAKHLWSIRDQWINFDFFAMSEFKCSYFGLPAERFKETIWHGN